MAIDTVGKNMNIGGAGIDSIRPGGFPAQPQAKIDGAEFKRALEQATQTQKSTAPQSAQETLKFSSHAIERMRSRGISFQPDTMRDIESAIGKAAAKGAKDTLVLAGDNALIVSVKNNTVVTVMDRATMKNNVFTNIDSTVVI